MQWPVPDHDVFEGCCSVMHSYIQGVDVQALPLQDLSWEKAAKQYEQLFDWAMMDDAVRPW